MNTTMRNRFLIIILVGVALIMFIRYINPGGYAGFTGGSDSFTLYYADWCGHCKKVKPVFQQWSKNGTVDIGGKTVFVTMVEADGNPSKVSAAGVKGFPTFMLQTADGKTKEFDGERSPAGWESWLKQNL